jgi:hypothetical protein
MKMSPDSASLIVYKVCISVWLVKKLAHLVIVDFERVLGDIFTAYVYDVVFELLDSVLLVFDYLLGFAVDAVEGVELFLQLDYSFVSFVQPRGQGDHDVTVFYQKRLETVYLVLVVEDLRLFTLDFIQLVFVLLSDHALFLFECNAELGCVFYHLATD